MVGPLVARSVIDPVAQAFPVPACSTSSGQALANCAKDRALTELVMPARSRSWATCPFLRIITRRKSFAKLVAHRTEELASIVSARPGENARSVGADHTIFGCAEGLGSSLVGDHHALGFELDRKR
jgi:hypothetical protein